MLKDVVEAWCDEQVWASSEVREGEEGALKNGAVLKLVEENLNKMPFKTSDAGDAKATGVIQAKVSKYIGLSAADFLATKGVKGKGGKAGEEDKGAVVGGKGKDEKGAELDAKGKDGKEGKVGNKYEKGSKAGSKAGTKRAAPVGGAKNKAGRKK